MNRWSILGAGLAVAIIAALVLRLPFLDRRPMHNDEAVNGIKFGQLWDRGSFKYDYNEHHGPSLFYATYAVERLTGAPDSAHISETRLRLVAVLFGLGLILLLPLTVDGLGWRPTLWAGLFTAVSPAMAFYSRYYIHEMLLVFATFLALAAGWRYWRTRKLGWALLAGAGIGLMHATKETFIITLAVAALALILNQIWNRFLDASGLPVRAPRLNYLHLAASLGVWIFVAVLFFSSFFTNASGPIDSVRTYGPWLNRAGGDSPHINPWFFYLHRLLFFHIAKGPVWTEALIFLLAIIGTGAGFVRKNLGHANPSFVRFLGLYSFGLAAAYSLISYKTPWCLLSFWHGMILLAGIGAVVLIRCIRHETPRVIFRVLLVIGALHLGWQAWRADVTYAADPGNPYVYAQTSPDAIRLVEQVRKLAEVSPQGRDLLLKVMAADADYWPLPWYFRDFSHIGWWDELLPDPFAPVMIVSAKFGAGLDEKKTHLMVGYFQLRPGTFFELYVQLDLWRAYLAKNPPKPE